MSHYVVIFVMKRDPDCSCKRSNTDVKKLHIWLISDPLNGGSLKWHYSWFVLYDVIHVHVLKSAVRALGLCLASIYQLLLCCCQCVNTAVHGLLWILHLYAHCNSTLHVLTFITFTLDPRFKARWELETYEYGHPAEIAAKDTAFVVNTSCMTFKYIILYSASLTVR